jgi:hypothetical protein
MLKHVLIDMWANDQNEIDHMDCKIITIEGEEIVFLVVSHGCFQCFEIQ